MSATPLAVVGGSGFIGSRLTARLARLGPRPLVIDLRAPAPELGADWAECNILDVDRLAGALAGASSALNLVGAHGVVDHPAAVYQALNVEGARAMCSAASAAGVEHLVFVSTAAVYGATDSPDEHRRCRPTGGYGTSKLAAEGVYREWANAAPGRRLAIVRPAVVFGPGDNGAGDRLFRYAAQPDLVLAGPGTNAKSMAFVDNLAAFLVFVAKQPDPSILFNYCDAPDMTLGQIVATARETLGLPPATVGPAPRKGILSSVRSALSSNAGGHTPGERAAREIRFSAERAHGSGFVQPTPLAAAIASTVEAELGWMKLKARASR